MHMTLNEHIQRYLKLANQADELFEKVRNNHSDLMPCQIGCNDCCSVYFELSLIEAYVIHGFFGSHVSPEIQKDIRERALVVEPLFREQQLIASRLRNFGQLDPDELIVRNVATAIIPCILNLDGSCLLYDCRPITCRLYGTPQKIGDRITACPKTGFQKNRNYLSIEVTKINQALYDYSRDFLIDLIGIAPRSFPGLVMPVPTALKTPFDKSFFISLRDNLESGNVA